MSTAPVVRSERLLTARFLTVVACGLGYFLSIGVLLPVVPQYVAGPLGGSELAVGVVVGAFAAGAVAVRPLAGRLGDRRGRRGLIIGGSLIVGISSLAYHLTGATVPLFLARLLGGVGEAAFFVGAGTMVTDLAPVSRRGEAISYWSIAVYGGLAFGPSLGELVLDGDHFGRVWNLSAALAFAAALVALLTRETVTPEPTQGGQPPAPLVHRAALTPGIVLFLGMTGLAGFAAFVPLYVSEIGMADSSRVFLLYGCSILLIRILGARVPDRIGPLRAGTIALGTSATGLGVVAAVQSPVGLYAGTLVFSMGMSMLYPAMLTLALTGVKERERGSAVGTISSFFDLSQGFGAAILGVTVAAAGYRGGFLTAAALAVVGFVLLRSGVDPRVHQPVDHDAAAVAREHVDPEPP